MTSSQTSPPARTRRELRTRPHTTRRALRPAGIMLGVALGVSAMVGTTASAAVPMAAPIMQRASLVAPAAHGAQPLTRIEHGADAALAEADAAVLDAATTTADVAAAELPIEGELSVDTTELRERADVLEDASLLPVLLPELTERVSDETAEVSAQTADLRARLDAALAQKAAEEEAARLAAEKAAAEKAAAEQAAAEAEAERAQQRQQDAAAPAAPVPSGAPAASGDNSPAGAQATAASMLGGYGWGDDQFSCLVSLWNKESGWNYQASNGSSGAYGIPQALPGSKMASAGGDWQTSAATQIRWGLGYISGRYGSPCGAWGHSQSVGWY